MSKKRIIAFILFYLVIAGMILTMYFFVQDRYGHPATQNDTEVPPGMSLAGMPVIPAPDDTSLTISTLRIDPGTVTGVHTGPAA